VVSHVAAVVNLLFDQFPSPTIAGISPVPLPPEAGDPYVTVQEILSKETESLSGPTNLSMSIIQIDVWDHDYEAADTLRTSIKDFLLAFTGDVTIASVVQAHIQGVNHNTDRELFNGDIERHQVITRLQVWWETV